MFPTFLAYIENFYKMVCHNRLEEQAAKSAVGASTDTLARNLRASLGELAGAPVVVTEAFGIEFASVRARRHYASKSIVLACQELPEEPSTDFMKQFLAKLAQRRS